VEKHAVHFQRFPRGYGFLPRRPPPFFRDGNPGDGTMKVFGENRRRFVAFSALLAALIAVGVLFLSPSKKSGEARKAVDTEIAGVDLTFLSFSKNNEKRLEVKCGESQKRGDRWLYLIGIDATIFKADKLNEDIHITADSGRTTEDFYDFDAYGHAVISSPSVSLSSDSFNLKNLNELSTEDPVTIQLKDLSGRAGEGLVYFIRNRVMKLTQAKGVLRRAGIPYDFQARILRVDEEKNVLILAQEAALDGNGASLRGDRVFMQFDDGFVHLQTAVADGHSHFHSQATREDGTRVSREIAADQIRMFYDPQGRLQLIRVKGAGTVSLACGDDSGIIRSDAIEISLDADSQSLDKVRTPARAELASRGRNNVKVGADFLKAAYGKDGSLETVIADEKCEFATDDFTGASSRLVYSARDSIIKISGENSSIVSGKNVFNSSQFLVRTNEKELETDSGVKAKLIPGKKSVLLGAKPIFVKADGLELGERGTATRFKDKVTLFQEEIELHAGELLFESRDNRISCRGGSDLKFLDENEQVSVSGKAITFDPAGLKIVIEGDAQLQQGPNTLAAKKIELTFDRGNKLQNISASDRVAFSKQDITGRAQSLNWLYSQKIVVFRNLAEITRKNAGTTRGHELRFDLVSNEITVSGAGDRSETTIHQELP
jgi:lipopolysaccharide export system protein LptA